MEFFTVEVTGESGMSQTGLAKLCGVTQPTISKLLSNSIPHEDENPLKAILDEALYLITWKTEKGREIRIIRSSACFKIIRHYDRKGNKVAQATLDKFGAMGIDAWIQGITGWHNPLGRSQSNSQPEVQPNPQPEVQPDPTPPPRFLPASDSLDLEPDPEMYQVMLKAGRQELYRRRIY